MAECQILRDVMKNLAKQRCNDTRVEAYAVQADAKGNEVETSEDDEGMAAS